MYPREITPYDMFEETFPEELATLLTFIDCDCGSANFTDNEITVTYSPKPLWPIAKLRNRDDIEVIEEKQFEEMWAGYTQLTLQYTR